jgi:hypothetical protein
MFDHGDTPAELVASTRYQYDVQHGIPLSRKFVADPAAIPTVVHVPFVDSARSMLMPVVSLELFDQVNPIIVVVAFVLIRTVPTGSTDGGLKNCTRKNICGGSAFTGVIADHAVKLVDACRQ